MNEEARKRNVVLRKLMKGAHYLSTMSFISIVMGFTCLVIYSFTLDPIWEPLAIILCFQGIISFVIAIVFLEYHERKHEPLTIPIKLLPAYLMYLDAMSPENQKRERQKMKIEDQLAGITSWTSRSLFRRKKCSDKNTEQSSGNEKFTLWSSETPTKKNEEEM